MFQIMLPLGVWWHSQIKKPQKLDTTALINSFMLAYYSKSDVPFQRGLEGKPQESGLKAELFLFQVSFSVVVKKNNNKK